MKLAEWFLLAALISAASAKKSDYHTAFACEGDQLRLTCQEGYLIHLIRANYGRFSISICNDHGNLDWSVDCTSHRSYYVIHERCNLMSSCLVSATSDTFTDPCPETYKYLEVQYHCKQESISTRSSSATPSTTLSTSSRPPIIIPLTRSQKPVFTTPFSTTSSATTTTDSTTTRTIASATTTAHTSFTMTKPHRQITIIPSTIKPRVTTHKAVINKENYCQPIRSRNLTWTWTKAGEVVVQKCPSGTFGEARWQCGTNPIQWVPDNPDLSECSSLSVDNLKIRVDRGDSVVNIAAELSVMTHRKPLYAGDVRHATEILRHLVSKMADKMQEIADDKQRHQLLKELLESATDVSSNLLETSSPWSELPVSERRHVAATLLDTLEQSGWLLATSHKSAFHFQKVYDNLLFSVQVLEAWAVSEVTFPSPEQINGTMWGSLGDSIKLPTQALLGSASNGVVKMVFAFYKHVKDFLGTVAASPHGISRNSSHVINSRVISASTGRYPAMKFAEPVTITFKLLQEENFTNPQCVYWDPDARLWSKEGCWLSSSNHSHAVCACNHLTNFALLMELKLTQVTTENHSFSRIIVFTSCGLAILFLLITVLLLHIFGTLPADHSTIHKHLSICLLLAEVAYIAGSESASHHVVCSILAGVLHLLLQAVFMWLFLAAFQLYLLLLEPAHSNKSRFRCYSFIAYGGSAIIVIVSAVIDHSSYGTTSHCFLRYDNYYIFSFVGPAISCVLGAVMFSGLTICRTCWFSAAQNKEMVKANTAKIRSREAWFVVLSSTCCWTFMLLYLEQDMAVLAYLFSALNISQGLAVFICFGLRNEEVQQAYKRKQGVNNDQEMQLKSGGCQIPLADLGIQNPALSSLSTVTNPELEYPMGAMHPFHRSELCISR